MNHIRMNEVKEDKFELNDIISFQMTNGEVVEAMAVKEDPDGMIFIAVDCLKKEYPLTNGGEYNYDNSIVRFALNGEVLQHVPGEIRERLVPFDNGDLLRIPTEREIFGTNRYGVKEPECVEQFEAMKQRRNRIALNGRNGDVAWYWLKNRDVSSAPGACCVAGHGAADYRHASDVFAVRPLFKIRNR